MSFFKKIEAFIFKESFAKIPFIFWLSPLLVSLLIATLFVKGFAVAPYLLIYSLFALVLSTRFQLKGLLSSAAGLILFSFLFKALIPHNGFSLYIASMIALGFSYMIQAFISESYEAFLVMQAKEASFAKEDQKLWKSRFENTQFKFEKEKESFEQRETEFDRNEDRFEETIDSMKHLLAMSQKENEKIAMQNERLVSEKKEVIRLKHAYTSLEDELQTVRTQLNEARVQLYQDRLLYQALREEKEKLEEEALAKQQKTEVSPSLPLSYPVEVEQLEIVLEKTMTPDVALENIYLDHFN